MEAGRPFPAIHALPITSRIASDALLQVELAGPPR
jgi:hypothetical protein